MTPSEALKQQARTTVASHRDELIDLSHRIHDHPEIGFEEIQASQWIADILENKGFSVERGVAELPTAFKATVGSGSLHLNICCEYDALPGIGHACGHNIIASAGVGAALALAPLVNELDLTLSIMGTPAEEGGGGKVFMLQRGVFDGQHASMMVHASQVERDVMPSLAVSQWHVEYFGKSAHAAAAPDHGISASAAQTLAQVGIGMLREHFETGDRVHGIVLKGGDAANIVPEHTKSAYFIRAATRERRDILEEKVLDVFRGAALMTGCSVEFSQVSPKFDEIKSHPKMAAFWVDNAKSLGRDSLPVQAGDGPASTDMGNISYAMPSLHPLLAIESNGANIHEAEFEKAAASPSADQAVIDGASGMAMTIIDIALDQELRTDLIPHRYDSNK